MSIDKSNTTNELWKAQQIVPWIIEQQYYSINKQRTRYRFKSNMIGLMYNKINKINTKTDIIKQINNSNDDNNESQIALTNSDVISVSEPIQSVHNIDYDPIKRNVAKQPIIHSTSIDDNYSNSIDKTANFLNRIQNEQHQSGDTVEYNNFDSYHRLSEDANYEENENEILRVYYYTSKVKPF